MPPDSPDLNPVHLLRCGGAGDARHRHAPCHICSNCVKLSCQFGPKSLRKFFPTPCWKHAMKKSEAAYLLCFWLKKQTHRLPYILSQNGMFLHNEWLIWNIKIFVLHCGFFSTYIVVKWHSFGTDWEKSFWCRNRLEIRVKQKEAKNCSRFLSLPLKS